MKSNRKIALLVVCVLLLALAFLSGLMWFGSHTYRDNESNFQRIFDSPRPANITVHRSEVWEGRHLFFLLAESSWHFELDAPQDFTNLLIATVFGEFTKEPYPNTMRDSTLPAWFAPKPPDAYERFDTADRNGSLFIDKQTGRLFIYHNDF